MSEVARSCGVAQLTGMAGVTALAMAGVAALATAGVAALAMAGVTTLAMAGVTTLAMAGVNGGSGSPSSSAPVILNGMLIVPVAQWRRQQELWQRLQPR